MTNTLYLHLYPMLYLLIRRRKKVVVKRGGTSCWDEGVEISYGREDVFCVFSRSQSYASVEGDVGWSMGLNLSWWWVEDNEEGEDLSPGCNL